MKKNLLLYILLAFLIVVNGFFLFNYLGKSKKHKDRKDHKGERKSFIIKKLDFDESQTVEFEKLQKEHREKIHAISKDIGELKDNLFDNISNENFNESDLDSITTLISHKEKEKDIEVFNHFKSIESICTDEQKIKFKSIIKGALHRQGKRGGKRGSHR